jgi:hypothetical protein
VFGALACGGAGAWLERRSSDRLRVWLGTLLAAGGVAGAATGWFVAVYHPGTNHAPSMEAALTEGAIMGVVAVLPLLPAFRLLWREARQRFAARGGSLAVGSERRRGSYLLLGVICTASFAALPDWLAHGAGVAPRPWEGDAVALVLIAAIIALALLEVRALGRIRRAAALHAHMKPIDEVPADAPSLCRYVDFGIGDDARASTRQSAPYRDAERIEVLLHGDAAASRALVRRALGRAAVCMLVILAALAAGRGLARPEVAFATLEAGCSHGGRLSCARALAMVEQGMVGVRPERVQRLKARGCALDILPRHWCRPAIDTYSEP